MATGDEYAAATGGTLKLKGVQGSKIDKKKKKKKKKKEKDASAITGQSASTTINITAVITDAAIFPSPQVPLCQVSLSHAAQFKDYLSWPINITAGNGKSNKPLGPDANNVLA